MAVAANEVVKLSIIGAMFGARVNWGWHFKALTGGLSLQSLSDDYQASIAPVMLNALSQDVGIMGFEVQTVKDDGDETLFDPVDGNVVGEYLTPSLPAQDAACFSVHTGSKGRRRRGRFYVSGISSVPGSGGEIPAAQHNELEAYATALQNRYCTPGSSPSTQWRMVIWSPAAPDFVTKKGVHTRLIPLTTDCTRITWDRVLRSQRRRQKGVGE